MAADVLSAAGARVIVFDRMPSAGRKLLMAGRGGLNLTHSEPFDAFLTRYGAATAQLKPMLKAFGPNDLKAWAEALGEPTFIGSSGRVFPKAMKASPLMRKWLTRLAARGVSLRPGMHWLGWDDAQRLAFTRPDGGSECIEARAALLALGGASWPKLGSDGAWRSVLEARGVAVSPFRPANVGFEAAWSEIFRERFAGQPLKNIALHFGAHSAIGEAMITRYGVEGGAVYALSPALRDALERHIPVRLNVDLLPRRNCAEIETALARGKRGNSLASTLRKTLGLAPIAINFLREAHGAPLPAEWRQLAALIKSAPITLLAPRGLERAISSAGGVAWRAVDEDLMLRTTPDVYVAGEMLDWEAPTGGYLLQACFATGVWAARAMLERTPALAGGNPR